MRDNERAALKAESDKRRDALRFRYARVQTAFLKEGLNTRQLAERFGLSRNAVNRILSLPRVRL